MSARPISDRAYATLIAASFARLAEHAPEQAARVLTDASSTVRDGIAFADRLRKGSARKADAEGRTLLVDTFNRLSDLLEGKPAR